MDNTEQKNIIYKEPQYMVYENTGLLVEPELDPELSEEIEKDKKKYNDSDYMQHMSSRYCDCIHSIICFEFYKKYDMVCMTGIELKKLLLKYNLKFVKLVNETRTHYNMVYKLGYNENVEEFITGTSCEKGGLYFTDIVCSSLYMKDEYKYIYDVEILDDSKIEIQFRRLKTDKFILSNERSIDKNKLDMVIYNNRIHDYMYINNIKIRNQICSTYIRTMLNYCYILSPLEHRPLYGHDFKHKYLRFISFDKLYNILHNEQEINTFEKHYLNKFDIGEFTPFIELTTLLHILEIFNINNIGPDDYIYDVELSDDSIIYRSTQSSMQLNGTKIKLTNKRRLIDDVLVLSYLYYNIFVSYSRTLNFTYNITEYFIDDTFDVKKNKLIDLFFNSRLYSLELDNMQIHLEKFILDLFGTNKLLNIEEKTRCIKQSSDFLRSLLYVIMNKKHILIETFDYMTRRNLCTTIINCITTECITINNSIDIGIINRLKQITE